MTKKFDRVLSDAELFELAALSNPLLHADSDGDFYLNETGQNIDFDSVMTLLRKVEQATIEALDKQLTDQGSVSHHIADMRKMVFDSDEALTIAERTLNIEITETLADELIQFARELYEKYAQADHLPDTEKMIERESHCLEAEVKTMVEMLEAKEWADHVGESALGKRLEWVISTLINELWDAERNHIADKRKMVADMYWISDEFSTETILDAFDQIVGMIDVSVGDTFEVKRAKTLPSITVEVTEMTEYGDVKSYKIIGAEHIPDASKMVEAAPKFGEEE